MKSRTASGKRSATGRSAAGLPNKKSAFRRSQQDLGEAGDFFLASDDDEKNKKPAEEEDDDEEMAETAEEKRLRLARSFLAQMQEVEDDDQRGFTGGSDEDEDLNAENQPSSARERLAERLKQHAAEGSGRLQRKIAHRVVLPSVEGRALVASAAAARQGHRLSATAVALTSDSSWAFTVSKDGSIVKWDIETMKRTTLMAPGSQASTSGKNDQTPVSSADWIKKAARQGSKRGLFAAAVSSDGKFLAVGGGDKKVHVYDAMSGHFIQSFPGHKDAISGLAFRDGSHQLFSCSFDRTVKMWSLDDQAYMDTLFGHQAEVLTVDVGRAEKAVTGGNDRTCRVWKVPEESQLIFRAPAMSVECVRFISGTEWLSGSADGSLQLWSQMKKKPIANYARAHGLGLPAVYTPSSAIYATAGDDDGLGHAPAAPSLTGAHDVAGWVQAVATCRGSDLVGSGAGDGFIRLWSVEQGKAGGLQGLECLGGLPAQGFINGLAIAASGRFVVAAVGQEPRLGRWMRDGTARNGLLVHQLEVE